MKYTFWIGRLTDGNLELWMEFFEPSQALAWKKKHFAREKDVVCVEHHESGKLGSSMRRTISYCPPWANGDNWRVICPETVDNIELIKRLNHAKAQKMRETKLKKDLEEKRVAMELSLAKEEAYGMSVKEHKDLTDTLEGDTK